MRGFCTSYENTDTHTHFSQPTDIISLLRSPWIFKITPAVVMKSVRNGVELFVMDIEEFPMNYGNYTTSKVPKFRIFLELRKNVIFVLEITGEFMTLSFSRRFDVF